MTGPFACGYYPELNKYIEVYAFSYFESIHKLGQIWEELKSNQIGKSQKRGFL